MDKGNWICSFCFCIDHLNDSTVDHIRHVCQPYYKQCDSKNVVLFLIYASTADMIKAGAEYLNDQKEGTFSWFGYEVSDISSSIARLIMTP